MKSLFASKTPFGIVFSAQPKIGWADLNGAKIS
jgi:hypothetical protein